MTRGVLKNNTFGNKSAVRQIMTVIISTIFSFLVLLLIVALVTLGLYALESPSSLDAIFVEYWFIYLALLAGWIWKNFEYWHITESVLDSLAKAYGTPFSESSKETINKGYVSNLRIHDWQGVAQISSNLNGLVFFSLEDIALYIPWKGIKSIFVIIEKSGKKNGKVNLRTSGLYPIALHIEWRDELKAHLPSSTKFLERVRT
ncbi:MAG: hypothetical protein OQL27_10805 [Sedimenticola sp.]|nr:hypothetical protein [Sedimenticola sp.]